MTLDLRGRGAGPHVAVDVDDGVLLPFSAEALRRAIAGMAERGAVGITDLIRFRGLLEGWAYQLAAQRATAADLTDLETALAAMTAAVGAGPEAFAAADVAFHQAVARVSRDEMLRVCHESVRDVVQGLIAAPPHRGGRSPRGARAGVRCARRRAGRGPRRRRGAGGAAVPGVAARPPRVAARVGAALRADAGAAARLHDPGRRPGGARSGRAPRASRCGSTADGRWTRWWGSRPAITATWTWWWRPVARRAGRGAVGSRVRRFRRRRGSRRTWCSATRQVVGSTCT